MRMFPPFNSNEGSQVMFLWRSKRNYLRIILKTPPYLRLRVFMHTILLWQLSILSCFNLKHLPFAYIYCIYLNKGWILSYCVNNPIYILLLISRAGQADQCIYFLQAVRYLSVLLVNTECVSNKRPNVPRSWTC